MVGLKSGPTQPVAGDKSLVSRPEAIQFYNKGCVAIAAGDFVAAGRNFEQALVIEPGSLMARYNLGCALRAAGDIRGAIVVFERCAAEHPDHIDSLYNLA